MHLPLKNLHPSVIPSCHPLIISRVSSNGFPTGEADELSVARGDVVLAFNKLGNDSWVEVLQLKSGLMLTADVDFESSRRG